MFRRYPGLTSGDLDVLQALEPDAARDFERLLQRQHDSDERQQRIRQRLATMTRPARRKRPRYEGA